MASEIMKLRIKINRYENSISCHVIFLDVTNIFLIKHWLCELKIQCDEKVNTCIIPLKGKQILLRSIKLR